MPPCVALSQVEHCRSLWIVCPRVSIQPLGYMVPDIFPEARFQAQNAALFRSFGIETASGKVVVNCYVRVSLFSFRPGKVSCHLPVLPAARWRNIHPLYPHSFSAAHRDSIHRQRPHFSSTVRRRSTHRRCPRSFSVVHSPSIRPRFSPCVFRSDGSGAAGCVYFHKLYDFCGPDLLFLGERRGGT